MNEQGTNSTPTNGTEAGEAATITEEPRRMTTRTKAAAGAGSAALLAFGLMLAGQVDNPVLFSSPDPDPEIVAEIAAEAEQDSAAIIDPVDDLVFGEGGDDVLIGTSSDDLLDGGDDAANPQDEIDQPLFGGDDPFVDPADDLDEETIDAILDGTDQGPAPDPAPVPPGLARICPSVQHGDTESGIWVRGEVYGLDDGWIWIEGPTLNGGDPIQVPVSDGGFDSPFGITQYGDHQLTRFELGTDAVDGFEPVDLLPALIDGPGDTFPVGPDEGSIFDQECFEFTPPVRDVREDLLDEVDADITDAGETDLDADLAEQERIGAQAEQDVNDFLAGFVDAHSGKDVAQLQATLHPSIRLAYGDDVCTEYIDRTAGSLTGAILIEVGAPEPLTMNTPTGPISFPEAIPFTVEFTVSDGTTFVNDAHLPLHDGSAFWLTTCGVDTP